MSVARGEGKECSCRITSVALICLPTHPCGSLRRSMYCSLNPGVALFPFSVSPALSSPSSSPLQCSLWPSSFNSYTNFRLISYGTYFIQVLRILAFRACALLNHAYTYAIARSSPRFFSLILPSIGLAGQRRQRVVKGSPRECELLFQANILVQSLKWKLC